jgi:hypothetical protein
VERSVFEELSFLYAPADATVAWRACETGPTWRLPVRPPDGAEVVLWGRPPWHDRPTAAVVSSAVFRELAIARLRAGAPRAFPFRRIARLPPAPRAGRLRRAVRDAVQSGLVVELARERPRRVIDEVLAAAGASGASVSGRSGDVRLRPSGDGSALARVTLADGTAGELRVARIGGLKDPRRAEKALVALEAAGATMVPRLLGSGATAGAAWTIESVLPGRVPAELTAPLLAELTAFLPTLPRSDGPPASLRDNLRAVGVAFPAHAATLDAAAPLLEAWSARLPAILVHGDLWLGNVLVTGGRLSGLIDWDASYPAGLAGSDLLNLLAMDERRRTRREIGELWTDAFWTAPSLGPAIEAYWTGLGRRPPDEREATAVAADWWAGQVVAALRRARRPAADPAWVRDNVDAIAGRIAALVRAGAAT